MIRLFIMQIFNPKKLGSLSDKLRSAMHAAKSEVKRVLLVDDDVRDCELIQKMVHRAFFAEIIPVNTTREARSLLDSGTQFDGIILDARVVNGNGVALYRDILAKWPNVPVVFLTGYDSPAFRNEVEAVGPAPVFQKSSAMRVDFMEQLLSQIGIVRKPDVV